MSWGTIAAILGAGGAGMAAAIYFAVRALAASRNETQAVRDAGTERDQRRTVEAERDRNVIDLATARAERDRYKAALDVATRAAVGAIQEDRDHAKDAIDRAGSVGDLAGIVSGELQTPLSDVPDPAAGR